MIEKEILEFCEKLWPLNRSLTGDGNRETLKLISEELTGLMIQSLPSNTQVLDWEIPKEWKIKDAYIIAPDGSKICSFSENNLHVVGYSIPIDIELSLSELKLHLYTIPEQPNAIPYVTSYYSPSWGFCMSHEMYELLEEGKYRVCIDAEHIDGEFNYGEIIMPGKSRQEVFLSTYICHPSMANNEISGIAVLTFIVKWLQSLPDRFYTYRIVFAPETIGPIAYLSLHKEKLKENVIAGLNFTCVGDDRAYSYMPSRSGNTLIDAVAQHVLKWIDQSYISYSWFDRGSDERQYCAPGIDLPLVSMMRTKYGEYPEYHTSLDVLNDVVTAGGLYGGFLANQRAIEALELNYSPQVQILCEPQMSKRGLYSTISSRESWRSSKLIMDFLSMCDGKHSLIEIAELLKTPIWHLKETIKLAQERNLISSKELKR